MNIGVRPPVPDRGVAVLDRACNRIGGVVDYLQDPSICMPWLVLRDAAGEWKTLLPDVADARAVSSDRALTIRTLTLLATTPMAIPDRMRRAALDQLVRMQDPREF